jgi:hypothetical protein
MTDIIDVLTKEELATLCCDAEERLAAAQARIQKLEQQLDWFARGKFINEWDNVQEMVERVRRRALGAIKYLANDKGE